MDPLPPETSTPMPPMLRIVAPRLFPKPPPKPRIIAKMSAPTDSVQPMITQREAASALAHGEFKNESALEEALETILHLYERLGACQRESDQNWRAAVGAMDEADNLYRENLNREY